MKIKTYDILSTNNYRLYPKFTSCLVLTYDENLLLQFRPASFKHFPEFISCFGGRIEHGESAEEAIVRELKEELGASTKTDNLAHLGSYTEAITNHNDLIVGYFWHDVNNTITGCYEGEPRYFKTIGAALCADKLFDDVPYLLKIAQSKGLI